MKKILSILIAILVIMLPLNNIVLAEEYVNEIIQGEVTDEVVDGTQDEVTDDTQDEITDGTQDGVDVDNQDAVDDGTQDDVDDSNQDDVDDTTQDDVIIDENATVATLSLCTCVYFFPFVGHAWIYVHNYSDVPQQVGLYEVPVGQGVSVGSFSFSVSDGWGLYYNLEAHRENRDGNTSRIWSNTVEMTQAELDELSDALLDYPNYWGFVGNCATFAYSMWNKVTGDSYFSMLIPAITWLQIVIGGAEKGALQMYTPTRDQVFRQRGSGDDAYLEPVGDLTYKR